MIGAITAGLYGVGVPPVTSSYESIATFTATGGETDFTFTSIPSTFKHLQIRGIYRDTSTTAGQAAPLYIRYNGSSSGYSYHRLRGDGTSATAGAVTSAPWQQVDAAGICAYTTAGTFGANIIDILDYSSTVKNKTLKALSGSDANTSGTQFRVSLSSGLWDNTSAITSMTISAGNTAFAAGCTFALYGIKG